jgi:parallel beta-helix repeat protein
MNGRGVACIVLILAACIIGTSVNFAFSPSSGGKTPLAADTSATWPSNETGVVTIDGDAALDAFCAGNGTDGLTPGSAYVIQNLVVDANGSRSGLAIKNVDRFLVIRNCTVTNASGFTSAEIFLLSASHVNVTSCTLEDGSIGIALVNASSCSLVNNIVTNNTFVGIQLEGSVNNILIGNALYGNLDGGIYLAEYIFSNSSGGLFFSYSNNNFLLGNNVSSNGGNGIFLQNAGYCTLAQNVAEFNDGAGIYLSESDHNSITGNIICENDGFGVYMFYSDYNTITANNLCDNVQGCILISFNVELQEWRDFLNWNSVYGNSGCITLVVPGGGLWFLFGLVATIVVVACFWKKCSRKIVDRTGDKDNFPPLS